MKRPTIVWLTGTLGLICSVVRAGDWCDAEVPVVSPGVQSNAAAMTAPSDAVVLFDGKDLSQWRGRGGPALWEVHAGLMTVKRGTGDIETRRQFKDFQLHIEWRVPADVAGVGQARANSGVILQGHYELQVLDSYHNETYAVGQAGAVYGQTAPLVNAMRKPGDWNVYDVVYTAPRFQDDGMLFSPARVTLLQNGVLIQNNTEIRGDTGVVGQPAYTASDRGAIRLQAHEDAGQSSISYRNIWLRELGVAHMPDAATLKSQSAPHASAHVLTVDSPVTELLSNAATRQVLSRCVRELIPPTPGELGHRTLRQIQQLIGGLTDARLARINAELVRVTKPESRDTSK
jgi:hypothetical protein